MNTTSTIDVMGYLLNDKGVKFNPIEIDTKSIFMLAGAIFGAVVIGGIVVGVVVNKLTK